MGDQVGKPNNLAAIGQFGIDAVAEHVAERREWARDDAEEQWAIQSRRDGEESSTYWARSRR